MVLYPLQVRYIDMVTDNTSSVAVKPNPISSAISATSATFATSAWTGEPSLPRAVSTALLTHRERRDQHLMKMFDPLGTCKANAWKYEHRIVPSVLGAMERAIRKSYAQIEHDTSYFFGRKCSMATRVTYCDDDQYRKLTRDLSIRHPVGYWRLGIPLTDGTWAIVTPGKMDFDTRELDGVEHVHVAGDEAFALVRELLMERHDRTKRLRASYGESLRADMWKESEYELVGFVSLTEEEIESRLSDIGLKYSKFDNGSDITWMFKEANPERVWKALGCCKT